MATRAHRGSLHRYRPHQAPVPDWATSQPIYRPRKPTTTPLYPVVQHHLETWLRNAGIRMRRRFRHQLKQEVADTLADAADAEDELRELFSVLG